MSRDFYSHTSWFTSFPFKWVNGLTVAQATSHTTFSTNTFVPNVKLRTPRPYYHSDRVHYYRSPTLGHHQRLTPPSPLQPTPFLLVDHCNTG